MRAFLLRFWRVIRTSYWFVPAIMVTGAVLLSWVLGDIDSRFAVEGEKWPEWLVVHKAANVRVVLSTVAGSMITVAGVTFSIVIVALSLASSQFGPRLLVNFMRDTGNQLTLGTFVSTYVFCILVLRQVDGEESVHIPQFSVAVAIFMSVASLGVLIYFFHHVSMSIQAEDIVAKAGTLLEQAICNAYPTEDETEKPPEGWPDDFDERCEPVPSRSTGYLNVIDFAALLELARKHDFVIDTSLREGDFVVEGSPLARIRPQKAFEEGDERDDDDLGEEINDTFHLARRRGTTESVQLAIDRLTEIGVRAMSPGINDPYTAIACIDRLGAGLALLGERGTPSLYRCDDEGMPRIRLCPPLRAELVDAGFQQLRLYGRDNVRVLERLLETLHLLASRLEDPEIREALARQGEMIRDTARETLQHAREREQIERAYETLEKILEYRIPRSGAST